MSEQKLSQSKEIIEDNNVTNDDKQASENLNINEQIDANSSINEVNQQKSIESVKDVPNKPSEEEQLQTTVDQQGNFDTNINEAGAASVVDKQTEDETDKATEYTEETSATIIEGGTTDVSEGIKFELETEETEEEEIEEEETEPHPLDELTDQQVIDLVNETEMENLHLELENILFENYIKENDPSLLDGIDEIMSYFTERKSIALALAEPSQTMLTESLIFDKQRLKLDSYTNITSIAEGKGPKINLSHKTEMVIRAMEDNQSDLETFLKKAHIINRNLKAELEEYSIREAEIRDAMDIFEFNVVTQGFDKLTQRIPAEKFIRYMEEWLKSAQAQIEKLRLRIATSKSQYRKVSQQLIQRQELGQNVHAVDLDQLEIENKHYLEKIEQKNMHLLELKKMNGSANLILSIHKKYLQKQQEDYNKLQIDIKTKSKQIQQTEVDCEAAENQLKDIYTKYTKCKDLKEKYTVPDVSEYINLKEKMYELKRNMKVWNRRKKIQDISLSSCIRHMKQLTGSRTVDPNWFEENKSVSILSLDDS